MFKLFRNLKPIDYLFILMSVGLTILQSYIDLTIPDYTQKIIGETDMNIILINGGIMLAMSISGLICAILI